MLYENQDKFDYGYLPDEEAQKTLYANPYQMFCGQPIGILGLEHFLPCPPGHVGNGYTYDFPVRFHLVKGTNQAKMHVGDESVRPLLIEAVQQLEREGVRAVFSNCGYFGHFQRDVADSVDIPVFLSSVMQVPWIFSALGSKKKLGLMCGDGPNLTYHLFEQCGVSRELYDRCVIAGAQDEPEFSTFVHLPGKYDNAKVREEMVKIAKKIVDENPDVGAILLECTDMPQHARQSRRL